MPLWIDPAAYGDPCSCSKCAALSEALSATKAARRALADAEMAAERAQAQAQAAGARVDHHHATVGNHRRKR
jgi:hypothetical protein